MESIFSPAGGRSDKTPSDCRMAGVSSLFSGELAMVTHKKIGRKVTKKLAVNVIYSFGTTILTFLWSPRYLLFVGPGLTPAYDVLPAISGVYDWDVS